MFVQFMANLWQKIFEIGNIFGNIYFSLQNGNFLAILMSQCSAIHIFSILPDFLSLTINKRSVLWESKCVLSRQNISSL